MSTEAMPSSSNLIGMTEALGLFAETEIRTTRKIKLLYIVLAIALLLAAVLRVMVKIESRIWSHTASAERKTEMGYNMDYNESHSAPPSVRSGGIMVVPVWQRLIRATLAFFRKYFCAVQVPIIQLSVAELILVLAYIGYMAYLVVSDTFNIPPTVLTPTFTVLGIANRSGKLAIASLPIVVLLSNRLNIVAHLMGISYDRVQYLHRWIGRTTLALAITHGTCKLIMWHSFADHSFRRFGLGAFCVACFALVFNQRYTMRHAYELFVAVHVAIVVALVTLLFFHAPKHKTFLYATIVFWGSDRAMRWMRMFIYNGLWRFGCSPTTHRASLRLLSHDTTRLEVYKHDFGRWRPGAYAYVSTPGPPFWPQSHPFTICSRPYRIRQSNEVNGGAYGENKEILLYEPNLIFLIRARDGWTRKLHDLAQHTTHPNVPVWIDGPYDSAPELHNCFDTVMLFAGGAGVSWTLPLLTDLLERARHNRSNVRRIVWVCVLRYYVNYDWLFGELDSVFRMTGGNDALVDIRIHYTSEADDTANVPTFFRPGRPDIGAIIEEGVNQAHGRVFIGSSGPAGPSNEVRRCARLMTDPMAILRGDVRGDIHCHTELFGW